MSRVFVGEDTPGKEGEAGNPAGLSMQPAAAATRRHTADQA